jgi:hypothetical protein
VYGVTPPAAEEVSVVLWPAQIGLDETPAVADGEGLTVAVIIPAGLTHPFTSLSVTE